jgi:hypothetical protein
LEHLIRRLRIRRLYHRRSEWSSIPMERLLESGLMEKQGVFISHIEAERVIAYELQKLLHHAFGAGFPVFVSSDTRSIEGGDHWYSKILDGLDRASVVIVLLSDEGVANRWINFEAGYGMAARARVIPTVIRGLGKGNVGYPLSPLQVRDLHSPVDVSALLSEIASHTGIGFDIPTAEVIPAIATFCPWVDELGKSLPSTGMKIHPYVTNEHNYYCLKCELFNTGNKDVEPLEVEVSIPALVYSDTHPGVGLEPNVFQYEVLSEAGQKYHRFTYRAYNGSTHPNYGEVVRLPAFLSSSMPPYTLKPPFWFQMPIGVAEGDQLPIRFVLRAKGLPAVAAETSYRELVITCHSSLTARKSS